MDPAPLQRALVAWRLLAVATTVLALGSGAHVLGGGAAPTPAVAALAGALVVLPAAALARRPLTVRALLPVALAGQLGVHAALTWLGAGAVAGAVVGGHLDHGAALSAVRAAPAAGAHVHPASDLMLAAHAVAMVATVLLLVATERGVLALARRWSAVLPALLVAAPPVASVPARPVPAVLAVPHRLLVGAGGLARRGPPAVLRPRATA